MRRSLAVVQWCRQVHLYLSCARTTFFFVSLSLALPSFPFFFSCACVCSCVHLVLAISVRQKARETRDLHISLTGQKSWWEESDWPKIAWWPGNLICPWTHHFVAGLSGLDDVVRGSYCGPNKLQAHERLAASFRMAEIPPNSKCACSFDRSACHDTYIITLMATYREFQ